MSVEINDVNFPEPNFRSYVRRFDTNSDGILSDEEIAAVTSITYSNGTTRSIKGIEFFTNLQYLSAQYCDFTDVPISALTQLQTLDVEYADKTFQNWDFSQNTQLKTLRMSPVYTYVTQEYPVPFIFNDAIENITIWAATYPGYLDPPIVPADFPLYFTNCANLKTLYLDTRESKVNAINGLNNKTALTDVTLNDPRILSLNLSGDTALTYLRIAYATNSDMQTEDKISSLNIAGCTALEKLHCDSPNISSTIDLSSFVNLTHVYLYHLQTALVLGNLPNLRQLYCFGLTTENAIRDLDVSGCPILLEAVAEATRNEKDFTNSEGRYHYYSYHLDLDPVPGLNGDKTLAYDVRTTLIVSRPIITSQPQDVTVPVNTTAHFYITATGENLQYEWAVSTDGGRTWMLRPEFDTGTDHWIYATADTDGYRFRCRVYNDGGEVISDAAILTVGDPVTDPPTITTNPADQTVNLGESATFSVVASGRHLLYQWERSTDGGTTWSDYQGLVYSSFTFTPRTSDTGNKYRCKVWNEIGAVYSNAATLTVTDSQSDTPPSITKHPTQVLVEEGTTALFSVTATGDNLTYQWQTYSNGSWTDIRNATASTYSFTASLSENGKQYRCKVFNSAGTVYSNAATLTVEAAESLVAPTVTRQPASEEADEGENVTFTVEASGEDLSYQWQTLKNGTWYPISGATGSSHTVSASASLNNSRYRCQISNQAGTVYSNAATLTVNQTPSLAPPTIKYNPQSRQVKEGTVVSFSVTAVGSSMTYQWQTREGTTWYPISGATEPTYSVSANLSMNGKQYRCVVTNEAGAATSTAATLTVNPLPDPTPTPTPTPDPVRPQSRKYWMINGLDILPYVIEGGIKWSRNDVDGDNAGRVIGNADMTRDRLAIKMRCDISCRPLFWQDINKILQAIKPEFVTVQYNDPMDGSVTRIMYSNNATATLGTIYDDDTELYEDLTFPLIEK